MRAVLVLTMVLAPGACPRAGRAADARRVRAAGVAVAAEHRDHAGAGGERGRVHGAREPGGTRRRRLFGTGRHARSCSGRARESDRQHGGSGPRLQRRPRHSAIQRASGVLPRGGDAEAVGLFGHSHGNVDADHRMERPLPRHEPQRSGRRHQLQRDGRRPDRRLRRRQHGHGPSGRRHGVDAGSGQGDRLRRPRHARDDRCRAKRSTAAYYGTAPKYSYMIECGGGSAAALHEVQKYPADYNGVVVGGHAAHLTRQIFGQLWLWQATHPERRRDSAGGEAVRHSRGRSGESATCWTG